MLCSMGYHQWMPHKYALSIMDPWNGDETEDLKSESPFMPFAVGDHVDTSGFGTRSEHRTLARVTKVIRKVSAHDGVVWDITMLETVPVDEYESGKD